MQVGQEVQQAALGITYIKIRTKRLTGYTIKFGGLRQIRCGWSYRALDYQEADQNRCATQTW